MPQRMRISEKDTSKAKMEESYTHTICDIGAKAFKYHNRTYFHFNFSVHIYCVSKY